MAAAYLFRSSCLRLADNPSLRQAASLGTVAAGYDLQDQSKPIGAAARFRLQASLRSLDGEIAAKGGRLLLADAGLAATAIVLAQLAGTDTVYTAADPTPQGAGLERQSIAACRDRGVELQVMGTQLLHDPGSFTSKTGSPYRVFTPFWRALAAQLEKEPPATYAAPARLSFADHGEGIGIGKVCAPAAWQRKLGFEAGEQSALRSLRMFVCSKMDGYEGQRDFPALPATSGLSAALHFGEISPARIYAEAASRANADKFLAELGWRDFSYHVLHQQPDLATVNFKRDYDHFEWRSQPKVLAAWRAGETGVPLVDAGMRQLHRDGYMHNRVRMVTASYLVKNLLQDWRGGAEHFWDELLDADLASNYASWQWVAGCGCDAAPYFRIFNPVLQSRRFDPAGEYIRAYLPELAGLPDKHVHAPWEAPEAVLRKAGIILGEDYPLPMVDLAQSRRRALEAHRQLTDRADSS